MSFFSLATDPHQYDGHVAWSNHLKRSAPIKAVLLQLLLPTIGGLSGLQVLDIGSGSGWLCDELDRRGGKVCGIDPAQKQIKRAHRRFPRLKFVHTDLDTFTSTEKFELVTTLMVIEHFKDLKQSFGKIRSLMSSNGRLIVMGVGYRTTVEPNVGFTLDVQTIRKGEAAVRVDRGDCGTLYNVLRTPEYIIDAAESAGFVASAHTTITAKQWVALGAGDKVAGPPSRPVLEIFQFALPTEVSAAKSSRLRSK